MPVLCRGCFDAYTVEKNKKKLYLAMCATLPCFDDVAL